MDQTFPTMSTGVADDLTRAMTGSKTAVVLETTRGSVPAHELSQKAEQWLGDPAILISAAIIATVAVLTLDAVARTDASALRVSPVQVVSVSAIILAGHYVSSPAGISRCAACPYRNL